MSTTNHIAKIAISVPLNQLFDYAIPDSMSILPGMRVKVPFGKRKAIGLVIEKKDKTNICPEKLKSILEVIDNTPILTKEILDLLTWTSRYYHYPIGKTFLDNLPALIRRGRKLHSVISVSGNQCKKIIKSPLPALTKAQKEAVDTINACHNSFHCFLLWGVTGSGKTEVYMRCIHFIIEQGKQALILVPEIGLTPQLAKRLAERFSVGISILHSGLTDKQRLEAWSNAQQGHNKIIIGTRSALFTPCRRLGIIIIDEEHDASFKQQVKLHYSARDMAIIRAKHLKIPIVLGSATPSLASLAQVKKNNYQCLPLINRIGSALLPKLHILNSQQQKLRHGLLPDLIVAIKEALKQENQVLLFLNQRGFAPVLLCHECGWKAVCTHCDSKMTLHQHPYQLICHHCLSRKAVPKICPDCHNESLYDCGIGTEKLALHLKQLFPDTEIIRIDRDSTQRKDSLKMKLALIEKGKNQILIGTQMLAKGHHFPNVTLVGIIDIDTGLLSTDFKATEQLIQLIIQVAGRAGRANKPGNVYLQTHYPNHPLLSALHHHGYEKAATLLLEERKISHWPPFSYLALLIAESTIQTNVIEFLETASQIAKKILIPQIKIWGPVPALMTRKGGRYRMQLLLRGINRNILQNWLPLFLSKMEQTPKQVRWVLDVDPWDLM